MKNQSQAVRPAVLSVCFPPMYETYESGFPQNVTVDPRKQYVQPFFGVPMYATDQFTGDIRKSTIHPAEATNTLFTAKSAASHATPHKSADNIGHVHFSFEKSSRLGSETLKSVADLTYLNLPCESNTSAHEPEASGSIPNW